MSQEGLRWATPRSRQKNTIKWTIPDQESNTLKTSAAGMIGWNQSTIHPKILKITNRLVGSLTVDLYRQTDSDQCGMCAALNLAQVLGVNLRIEQRLPQIREELFSKRQRGTNENASNFWLSTDDIGEILQREIPKDSIKNILTSSTGQTNIRSTLSDYFCLSQVFKALIINTGNHWLTMVYQNRQWYQIDSIEMAISVVTEQEIKSMALNTHRNGGGGCIGLGITRTISSTS